MHFLATGKILRAGDTAAHMPEEARAVDELRAQGFIQDMFFLQPGPGVVTLVEAPTREAAETSLGRLPFVALGLMEFDLTEVVRR